MEALADDHDSPWKEALEVFFPQAMALLAPELHRVIDWSQAPQFLDKELQTIVPPGLQSVRQSRHSSGHLGRRLVDKLVRVRLLDGVQAWLLVHIEVQGKAGGGKARQRFAARMYEYRYLIYARFRREQLRREQLQQEQGGIPAVSYEDATARSESLQASFSGPKKQPLGSPAKVIGHSASAARASFSSALSTSRTEPSVPPKIYSLGILVDSRSGPSHLIFSDEYLGQGTKFSFPVVDLSQFRFCNSSGWWTG